MIVYKAKRTHSPALYSAEVDQCIVLIFLGGEVEGC